MTRLVKLSSLKADLEREKKGDWVSHPDLPGVSFNVSALTLPEYKTARGLLFQRLGKTFGDKPIPDEVLSAEIGALYSDHILHDWKGLDTEYTAAVAREALTDPAYRFLVSAVEFCAAKLSQVDVEFTKAEEGNS